MDNQAIIFLELIENINIEIPMIQRDDDETTELREKFINSLINANE